jgi:hypothetical protein
MRWPRNHLDRFVHFLFGLLRACPTREVYCRIAEAKGFRAYFPPLELTMAASMMFELFEWGTAVFRRRLADNPCPPIGAAKQLSPCGAGRARYRLRYDVRFRHTAAPWMAADSVRYVLCNRQVRLDAAKRGFGPGMFGLDKGGWR